MLLVNSWSCYKVLWLTAGSLLCRRGGNLSCGLPTFSESQASPALCSGSVVLRGFNRGKRNWLLNSITCTAEMPCGTQICRKGGSESGQAQLLEKRSLSDSASVSWASYLESFFLWLPLVCGFSSVVSASVPVPLPGHETCLCPSFSLCNLCPSLLSSEAQPFQPPGPFYSPTSWVYLDFLHSRTHPKLLGSLITNKGMEQHSCNILKIELAQKRQK